MSRSFDVSALAPVDLEFVLVADTHDMESIERGGDEFSSRPLQGDRARVALELAEDLPGSVMIHMGDLIQAYPESAEYGKAFDNTIGSMKSLSKALYLVAGNHDIGDKPDPTMPTHPVRPEILKRYHEKVGCSWYVLNVGGWRIFVLNSQVFGSGLPEEETQRQWLEGHLQSGEEDPTMLLLHLPLYLGQRDEPALGNYDVIDNRTRRWLLDLIEAHGVNFVGGAHVHFQFFDRIGHCEYHQFASTSFTRPGFAHLFASAAPPERGRDDRCKLGIYLMRAQGGRMEPYFIRTYGATAFNSLVPAGARLFIAPRSSAGRSSPLGLTMKQPLVSRGVVPIAFPSVRRQEIRCDYPFFLLQELGVQHLRLPIEDWSDPLQRSRIDALADRGVAMTAIVLSETVEEVERVLEETVFAGIDVLEWQMAGRSSTDEEEVRRFSEAVRKAGARAALAPVIAGEDEEGKQHPRTRIGFSESDIRKLEDTDGLFGSGVEVLCCRVSPKAVVWEGMQAMEATLRTSGWKGIIAFSLELGSTEESLNAWRVVQALAFCCSHEGTRLFVDPLTDLDRTMDETFGLCTASYNPRDPFVALRTLNGILVPQDCRTCDWRSRRVTDNGITFIFMESGFHSYLLAYGDRAVFQPEVVAGALAAGGYGLLGQVDLRRGLTRPANAGNLEELSGFLDTDFPMLLKINPPTKGSPGNAH